MAHSALPAGRLIRRQKLATRISHWIWAVSLFFLLLSGLQIFNAHPTLYLGDQSGFTFDNALLKLDEIPGSATIPSTRDLATGRVVHFFFAWIFVLNLIVFFGVSWRNRHLKKDLVPSAKDARHLAEDVRDHLKLTFVHGVRYTPLQKLAYAGVLFVLFPLIVLTGLSMSPGMNAVLPWLPDLFGGRQSARTLHFALMALLTAFFVIHMIMIGLAGAPNELRSIITGRYRIDPRAKKGTPHV